MIFHKASESQPDSILTDPNFAVTSLYSVYHTSSPLKSQNAERFLILIQIFLIPFNAISLLLSL